MDRDAALAGLRERERADAATMAHAGEARSAIGARAARFATLRRSVRRGLVFSSTRQRQRQQKPEHDKRFFGTKDHGATPSRKHRFRFPSKVVVQMPPVPPVALVHVPQARRLTAETQLASHETRQQFGFVEQTQFAIVVLVQLGPP